MINELIISSSIEVFIKRRYIIKILYTIIFNKLLILMLMSRIYLQDF